MISFVAILVLAQIGYPGQYPPGQYPGGQGTGLPFPRRHPKTNDSDSKKTTQQFRGWIDKLDDKSLEIESPDHRVIVFKLNSTTKKADTVKSGDFVEIDAVEDDRGFFTAVDIRKGANPPVREASAKGSAKQEPADAVEPVQPSAVVKPPDAYDPEDEGPPHIQRGIPKPSRRKTPEKPQNEPVQTAAVATPAPAPAPEPDMKTGPIQRARAASENFLQGLPNYVCQQFTTRYEGEGHPVNWRAQDVVSADVVYEDGKERYEKLAINGRPVKGAIEETGSWSTGEFGTVLADLFSPSTHADFKFSGERTISGQSALVYKFEVERPNSHWNITVSAQSVRPAYRGSVWLAKDSGRVLRIEMQGVKMPEEFPEDTVELAVDYGYVNLGTDKFLLPTRAEMLGCFRGSSNCVKNVVEFRTYRKFTGQSNIVFR